jgi:hypothetical protein
MQEAMRELLGPQLWQTALPHVPFEEVEPEKHQKLYEEYIRCVMHAGMKSLEVLVPGGPERLRTDLERIASGIISTPMDDALASGLLASADDPWLWEPCITLADDMAFTLWSNLQYFPEGESDYDDDWLMDAIRHPPIKPVDHS